MTGLTRASLAHRTVVILVTLLLSGLGVYTAGVLKQELIPSIEIPQATVITIYPGAAPEVVERDVSKPLESAVKAVDGVTRVTSRSSSGVSQVRVEWEYGEKADRMTNDLRTAIDSAKSQMPADASSRLVAGNFDDFPVVVLAVSSDADPVEFAAEVREVLLPRLKSVAGVRDVVLAGEQKRQVTVTLKQDAVTTYGVDVNTIGTFFTANGMATPAGTLQTGTANLDVQVGTSFASVDDIKQLRLQGTDGPVELGQIADVVVAPVDSATLSRVNGKTSLTLQITKVADGNTVSVAQGVRAAVPDLQRALGPDAQFATVFDQSPFIEQSIHDLTVEGGLGLAMAILVILIFLRSIRPTVITAISIPLSLFMALIGLQLGGFTLNILTLGALTVAIGRVVDDSIVVIENIKRHQALGNTGTHGIIRAVREVAGAVTSSTLTTVAVFLPIGLVGGQAGELFRPFAVTVTVALLASWLVSLTVVPVLASWFMGRSATAQTPAQQARAAKLAARDEADAARNLAAFEKARTALVARQAKRGASEAETAASVATLRARYGLTDDHSADDEEHGGTTWLQRSYLPALRWSLAHRGLTLALALALFAGTMALAPRLKTDFIGEAGQTNLSISQDLPAGTSLGETDQAARKVEALLAADPAVQTYTTSIGGASLLGTGQNDTNHAQYSVTLKPGSKGAPVSERLRAALKATEGLGRVEVTVGQASSRILVYIDGNDPAKLREANAAVLGLLQGTPDLSDIKSDLADARAMLAVDVDEAKAAAAGMTQGQIGLAVMRALRGQKVGTLTSGDASLEVLLRSQAPATTAEALAEVVLPVTQKQTIDARKAAADEVTKRQTALQEKQKADGLKQFNESIASLRSSRAKLATQLKDSQAKLRQLQALLAAPPSAPVMPSAPDPYAAVRGQIAQLTAAIEQIQAQISSLSTQESKLQEQRTKSLQTADQSTAIADAAKDAQKATASPLKLKEVATVTQVDAPALITRVDGSRTATVTALPTGSDLGATTTAIKKGLAALELPDGVQVRIGGVSQQQQDSFAQLGLAMLVAIGIVYLIMVATFGSLVQPLMLLVSIPFAATGAVALLLLTDTPLGIPSMIGLLMLIGIVVTNAIVLIDLINQLRRRGAGVDDAIMHGARLRLRPIIMTALATIMALVPMGLGVTGGGVFISKPLAIVVIGGLVSSTVLTLVLVPVLYDLVEKARERYAARRAARATASGDAVVVSELSEDASAR